MPWNPSWWRKEREAALSSTSFSSDDDSKHFLAGTDSQPQLGGLIRPVQDFLDVKAVESSWWRKERGAALSSAFVRPFSIDDDSKHFLAGTDGQP